jgi:hypothetical protein
VTSVFQVGHEGEDNETIAEPPPRLVSMPVGRDPDFRMQARINRVDPFILS